MIITNMYCGGSRLGVLMVGAVWSYSYKEESRLQVKNTYNLTTLLRTCHLCLPPQ